MFTQSFLPSKIQNLMQKKWIFYYSCKDSINYMDWIELIYWFRCGQYYTGLLHYFSIYRK